jgi:hypothetical protein
MYRIKVLFLLHFTVIVHWYSDAKDKIMHLYYSNEVQNNSMSMQICRVIILRFIERMVAMVTIHFSNNFLLLSIFNNERNPVIP